MGQQMDYVNLPEQAALISATAEELFGKQILGIYLYGSFVLGGLHPNSDIDILMIINGEMLDSIRKELTKRLLVISGKPGCVEKRPLEVTVICFNDIVPWRFPPKYEYMYGEWLREEIETGKIPQPNYDADLAILLWQARMHSRPLKGAQADMLIPLIPFSEVKKSIRASLDGLISGIKGDERNVLLTLARMWFTLETREICPKNIAAEWAVSKLSDCSATLMKLAGKAYLGECADQWGNLEKEVLILANDIKKELEKYWIRNNVLEREKSS